MSRWSTPGEAHAYETGYIEGMDDAKKRKQGKWTFSPSHSEGICSSCQFKIYGRPYNNTYLIVPYNFCPNCGADMRERSEDE